MVLGISVIHHRLLLLALCLVGWTTMSLATEQTATVGGWRLHLLDRNGVCILEYTRGGVTKEFTLTPTPPCRFVDRPGAFPQTARLRTKSKMRTLVLVFGTPYQDTSFNLPAKDVYCGTVSQAVMLTNKKVYLSQRIAEGGLRCEGYGVDEREFMIFNEEWR